MSPSSTDPATVALMAAFSLAAYLTDRCLTPPNGNPSGPASSLPKDDVAPSEGHIYIRRFANLLLWLLHIPITIFYPSPPAALCPNARNLSSSLFTWSPCTVAALMGIIVAAPLRLLAFRELKENFTFRLAEPKTLVETGVYAYVQHPSYAANCLGLVSNMTLLLRLDGVLSCALPGKVLRWGTRSGAVGVWTIVLAMLVVVSLISITIRVKDEEAMLGKKFGKEWEEYHRKTKRFVPGIF